MKTHFNNRGCIYITGETQLEKSAIDFAIRNKKHAWPIFDGEDNVIGFMLSDEPFEVNEQKETKGSRTE